MGQTHWDSVFSRPSYHYGTEPNAWIRDAVTRYVIDGRPFEGVGITAPEMIRVVELAAGEGRNAAWLAGEGFDVTAFDRSSVGLEKAVALARNRNTIISARTDDVIDLARTAEAWKESVHVVVSTFFHVPPPLKPRMFAAHATFVAPGGFVFAEWFHPDQRHDGHTSGGPPDPAMLVTPEEVRSAFEGWRIFECRRELCELSEGAGHRGTGVVTRFAAQRTG
ncbi:MAG: class I SAM-dependent methyltransferase [Alkalispirochaeta sp.]